MSALSSNWRCFIPWPLSALHVRQAHLLFSICCCAPKSFKHIFTECGHCFLFWGCTRLINILLEYAIPLQLALISKTSLLWNTVTVPFSVPTVPMSCCSYSTASLFCAWDLLSVAVILIYYTDIHSIHQLTKHLVSFIFSPLINDNHSLWSDMSKRYSVAEQSWLCLFLYCFSQTKCPIN